MDIQYHLHKKIGLIAGPLLFLTIYNLPFQLLSPEADQVLSVVIWMIVWWITEAVSISVTALIPLTFFPLTGIMDLKTVAANYGSPIIFLFFGGFVMALALEKVNLHKRIALTIIRITGTSPNRVILGFMIATAFLSMWISNTATTVVMLPIAQSVISLLIKKEIDFDKNERYFALSILLGIAYAANVGGIATIIGTPPNTVLVGFMENEYNVELSFMNWMLMGIPFTTLMIFLIFWVIVKWIYPNNLSKIENSRQAIDQEYQRLGPVSGPEKRVLIIFMAAIFLWIFRVFINQLFPFLKLTDASISMLAAFALFSIPFKFNQGEFTLQWKDTQKLPWGILILFGGGLALANGLSQAGIIDLIGNAISSNSALNAIIVSSLLIMIMLFMTEVMSNVALVAIFAPVISGIAMGLDTNMLHILIPVAMASSCAFMLPMSTPPNAIVFASGHIKVKEMVRVGIFLNVFAVIILIGFSLFIIPYFF